jgi:hypothetical protein
MMRKLPLALIAILCGVAAGCSQCSTHSKVFIVGGLDSSNGPPASSEAYNPDLTAFDPGPSGVRSAVSSTATVLNNGKVLIVGKRNRHSSSATNPAQIYDPQAGQLSDTSSTTGARENHTATLLGNQTSDGVLIAGGSIGGVPSNTAELYDPVAGSFTATGSMAQARAYHTAVLLGFPGGKVLIAGGQVLDSNNQPTELSSTELFDQSHGSFAHGPDMSTARMNHTATLLYTGKVLIVGGQSGSNASSALSTAELYDPQSNAFSATGGMSTARALHTATVLIGGKVLVCGGLNGSGALRSCETYDPSTGLFASAGQMVSARQGHTATQLDSGKVLIAGGSDNNGVVGPAELFDSTGFSATATMLTPRQGHAAVLLPNR